MASVASAAHLAGLFMEMEVDLVVTGIPSLRAWRVGEPKETCDNHSE